MNNEGVQMEKINEVPSEQAKVDDRAGLPQRSNGVAVDPPRPGISPPGLRADFNHHEDALWSDVDTEEEEAESFEEFARKHSSNSIFQSTKSAQAHPKLPNSSKLLRKRSKSPSSLCQALQLTRSPENREACKSAPHSPHDSPLPSPVRAKDDLSKEMFSRSRSLENYAKKIPPSKSPGWTRRLFSPPSIVLTQPNQHRKSNPSSPDTDQAKSPSDLKTGPFDFSISKLLRQSSTPNVRKWHPGKGHVVADDEFQWKKSGGNLNADKQHTATNHRSSTGSLQSTTLPAGSLLTDAVQPSAAPMLGASVTEGGSLNASGVSYDTVDGSPAYNEQQRNRHSIELEHLQQKILKISEAIKLEQGTRDENVAEYLKLSGNADKQQAARIKTVFEKKNQKSSATIAQLQKKLDSYHRRLKELESNGSGRQSRIRDLRDFSGGVVDSVKQATQNAAGAIVSKPKDFAFKLKNRFGSADNLTAIDDDVGTEDYTGRYTSADDVSSTSGSIEIHAGGSVHAPEEFANNTSIVSGLESPTASGAAARKYEQKLHGLASQLLSVQAELDETRRLNAQFQSDWNLWKNQMNDESTVLTSALQEERFRYERLEEQFNDLTELHQREVSILKQELTSMEEKVEYHARERARDFEEAIENCQTRLAKMELQQQQLVSVEGLENANARVLLGKVINLLLSVLAVILVVLSTISGILTPLVRSPARLLATLVAVIACLLTHRNWTMLATWLTHTAS